MRQSSALTAMIWIWASAAPSFAESATANFGLLWGQSALEATESAKAKVLSRALHQRFGLAYEVDRLPVVIGDEIHRILYFDDDDKLQRVWIDFGHPGGRVWEENYLLDDAIVKYQKLKSRYEASGAPGECVEPELRRVEEEGRLILERNFARNQTVWACDYERGSTRLKISMRRLGDSPGQRFDVIFDARDHRAVAAFQQQHRLRSGEE